MKPPRLVLTDGISGIKARSGLPRRGILGQNAAAMLTWLVLAAIALVSGGLLAYKAGKGGASRPSLPSGSAEALPGGGQPPLLERGLGDVRVDDVVQHQGRDWLVEGIIRYEEDGHAWRGARLMDGTEEGWLIVGLDRGAGTNVRLLRVAPGVELSGYPPEALTVDGTHFNLAKRGTATAVFEGQLGALPVKGLAAGASLRCRWWRYQAAGDKVILVEQWGDTYRALSGAAVSPDELELLAAS